VSALENPDSDDDFPFKLQIEEKHEIDVEVDIGLQQINDHWTMSAVLNNRRVGILLMNNH
jgi:hypothetical protein